VAATCHLSFSCRNDLGGVTCRKAPRYIEQNRTEVYLDIKHTHLHGPINHSDSS